MLSSRSGTSAGFLAATSADVCHVFAVSADGLSTLAACLTGLIGRKFMGCALGVGGPAAFTGDLSLFLAVH